MEHRRAATTPNSPVLVRLLGSGLLAGSLCSGVLGCGSDPAAGSGDEPALSASGPTSDTGPSGSSSSLVGGGGIMTVSTDSKPPGGGMQSPGPGPETNPGPNAGSGAGGAEPGAGGMNGSAEGGGATSPSGAAGASTGVGDGGASGAAAGPGGAPSAPGGGAGAGGAPVEDPGPGNDEEPVFDRPEGTIPNTSQPGSMVDVDQNNWQEGLVSPTMDATHQINQPAVLNGYLVVGGNEEFWVYDVSDPTAPRRLSNFTTPNRRVGGEAESHTLSFARYGDKFYMVTIGGTGIDTWDMTDVTNPQHLAKVPISGTNYGDYTEAVWGVAWQGQYIYVGATNNGIHVVDASDPASPEVVKQVSTSQYGNVSAGPVEAVGNVLVVMTPKESGGIATLDISDPTNPTRLASLTAEKSYIGQFYRRYAFLISPLRAWDVLSDPRNISPNPMGTMNHGGAEYLTFSDDYLYLGLVRAEIGGTPGASKINIQNPSNMRTERHVWGRMNLGGLNDDQFTIPFGSLLVLGDDQAPYAGWVIAAHDTEPDAVAPEVDTVIPKDGETGVSTTSRIGVSLSDNIELKTVNQASFFVRPQGGSALPGKYGSRMGVLNFDPDEDLEPGTTYEVVLRAGGVADLVGNTLETEWISTFTTN